MARLADSEQLIWEQAETLRRLRGEYRDVQVLMAALLARQGGVAVLTPAELAAVPPGMELLRVEHPDGEVTVRTVRDGPGQPGRPGQ